jgi:hypothetical protein
VLNDVKPKIGPVDGRLQGVDGHQARTVIRPCCPATRIRPAPTATLRTLKSHNARAVLLEVVRKLVEL